jgi:hypothetical protein
MNEMRLKQCFLLLSVAIIGFILHSFSIFAETSGSKVDTEDKFAVTSLDNSDKEELAKQIFFELRHVEKPAEKAMLYRKVVDECSGIELAQEALWKLSRLYLDDFDEPNVKEAIGCLEQFIKLYPYSEWRSHVEFSLLGLYESEKSWRKVVSLCEKIMNEDKNIPVRLREELLRRSKAAKEKI